MYRVCAHGDRSATMTIAVRAHMSSCNIDLYTLDLHGTEVYAASMGPTGNEQVSMSSPPASCFIVGLGVAAGACEYTVSIY
jgi:hypothetical protein